MSSVVDNHWLLTSELLIPRPPVFDEVSKELVVDETNPFGEGEEDDEYDSSGKNPFAE